MSESICVARRRALTWAGGTALAGAWPLAHAQSTVDIASSYPEGNFHVTNLQQFAADVQSASGGKLLLKVHAGGSLAKAADIRKKVTEGTVAMGEVFGPSLSALHGAFALDAVPFLATNYTTARKLWKTLESTVEAKLATEGLTLLASVPWPPQGLFSSKPIVLPKEMEGLAMRENSPPVKRLAELVGTKPVRIETPDLAAAARERKFDLVFTSAAQGIDTKLYETLPYFYQANAWLPRNLLFVNQKTFNALPREQQLSIVKLAGKAEERGWEMSERFAQTSTQALAQAGGKVAPLPPAVRTRLERLGNQIARETVEKSDPQLMVLVSRFLL
jgi:TRAP-type transport system periplasmic protein